MKHIAILREPFYSMVLNGKKTIESRWGMNKCAPYNKVKVGDTIYIKKTGCPITATAVASKVKYYQLTPDIVEDIRQKYGKSIGTDKFEDWQSTLNKKYCTLIWLTNVQKIEPIKVKRSNGAGWLIID